MIVTEKSVMMMNLAQRIEPEFRDLQPRLIGHRIMLVARRIEPATRLT